MSPHQKVFDTLASSRGTLKRRFGVKSLGVFGSCARGDTSDSSDVHILVEFETPTFDRYMDLKFYLEDMLRRRVDLVLKSGLKPSLRERILREVRNVA